MSTNQGETYWIISKSDWNSVADQYGSSPYSEFFEGLFVGETLLESSLMPGYYFIPLSDISDDEAEFLRNGDVDFGGNFTGFSSFGQYTFTLSTQPIGG